MYDLFVLETPDDVHACALSGVFDFSGGDVECENCRLAVGFWDEVFVPFSVVIDPDDDSPVSRAFPICVDCIAPAIMPGLWWSSRRTF